MNYSWVPGSLKSLFNSPDQLTMQKTARTSVDGMLQNMRENVWQESNKWQSHTWGWAWVSTTLRVFAHVRDVHTFLHRTAISAIKVTFLLNPSKVEVCVWGVAPVINKCKESIHALFPLYLACSRSWTMCSCPLDLAIDRGVPHCVKRQWS